VFVPSFRTRRRRDLTGKKGVEWKECRLSFFGGSEFKGMQMEATDRFL
jgi:hypothetical protein